MRKRKKKPKPGAVIPNKTKVGKFGRCDVPNGNGHYTSIMAREIVKLTTKRINARNVVKKKDKPAMMALAEASQTKREIRRVLLAKADAYFDRKSSLLRGPSRRGCVELLNGFCDNRHWSNFQRKRMVEQVVAKAISRRKYYPFR